jgi:hypothetical protein
VRKVTIFLLSLLIGLTGSRKTLQAQESGPTKSVLQAASDGDIDQLKSHLAKGANFNIADSSGNTPLKLAIQWHHTDAAKLIIESGKADLNAKDPEGRTPLLVALTNAENDVAQMLIDKGADIKAKDKNDMNALHAALRGGQAEMAKQLIEKGADVNSADRTGQTPLTYAQQRGMVEIVGLLKQKGAKEPVSLDEMYGGYGAAAAQGQPQPSIPAAPAREEVVVDVNAIRAEVKGVEGLEAALKVVDDKSTGEQQSWIQRRADNRTLLVLAVERQFADEMAFVKPIATEEKATKTVQAIDEVTTVRKKRFEEIGSQLREQRRAALASSRGNNNMTGGRSMRGGRGGYRGGGAAGGGAYSPASPYGAPGAAGARMPARPAPAEVNEPVLDPETQAQAQVWLNSQPDDKKALLDAVHQANLVDLDDLRLIAVEEQAKKTATALSGLMMLHEERVQKIAQRWQEDDERMQKLQERYGPGGMPGRGMPQQNQPGMRGGRRGR